MVTEDDYVDRDKSKCILYFDFPLDKEMVEIILKWMKSKGLILTWGALVKDNWPKDAELEFKGYYLELTRLQVKKLKSILESNDTADTILSIEDLKPVIGISREKGIYRLDVNDPDLVYPITGNRSDLVWKLRDQPKVMGALLSNDLQSLSKAVNAINILFRNKLGLDMDLILHMKTDGYKLNYEHCEIQFN